MRVLVCGGAGFIGSHFARLALERGAERVVIYDALTYAGHLSTVEDVLADSRARFVLGRIQDADTVAAVLREERLSHVANFAAETHNDRSLLESGDFIQTNAFGVHVLLECVRAHGVERMVQVSTDEVYGWIESGAFTESSPLLPNTPYSASKAGGDLLCRASHIAHGTPVIVTRGGNTYGPYQYPEKLIAFFATRLIQGKRVPLYGEGDQMREWIHVRDHAAGIWTALTHGSLGEVYNVGDANERTNRWTTAAILRELRLGEDHVRHISDPRGAAHDRRYSMDSTKLRQLGWRPEAGFEEGLAGTVRWYRDHEAWWRPIVESPGYVGFVREFYGQALGEDL